MSSVKDYNLVSSPSYNEIVQNVRHMQNNTCSVDEKIVPKVENNIGFIVGERIVKPILDYVVSKFSYTQEQIQELEDFLKKNGVYGKYGLDKKSFDQIMKLEVKKTLWDKTLPDAFGLLTNLKEIKFSGCYLDSFPKQILELSSLKEIQIDRGCIKEIPAEISKLKSLECFWMNEHKLTSLPEEFGALKNLRKVVLQGNEFTQVPECLTQLPELEWLILTGRYTSSYLSDNYNRIETLSESILNLSQNLETMAIDFSWKADVEAIEKIFNDPRCSRDLKWAIIGGLHRSEGCWTVALGQRLNDENEIKGPILDLLSNFKSRKIDQKFRDLNLKGIRLLQANSKDPVELKIRQKIVDLKQKAYARFVTEKQDELIQKWTPIIKKRMGRVVDNDHKDITESVFKRDWPELFKFVLDHSFGLELKNDGKSRIDDDFRGEILNAYLGCLKEDLLKMKDYLKSEFPEDEIYDYVSNEDDHLLGAITGPKIRDAWTNLTNYILDVKLGVMNLGEGERVGKALKK